MPTKPAEFDQILAEGIERCTASAASSGLDGEALITFSENAFSTLFGPAIGDVCTWISESSGGPFAAPTKEHSSILRTVAEVIAKKARLRRSS